MAVTRRIGNLTIHFLGENAEILSSMFDDAHARSKTFSRDMVETSRVHKISTLAAHSPTCRISRTLPRLGSILIPER